MRQQMGLDPSLSQTTVNAATGFGDGASFGLSNRIRELNGTNGSVNKCSSSYRSGDLMGGIISPAGRIGYIGRVGRLSGKIPVNEVAAIALSAERNAIKAYYRGFFANVANDYKTAEWAAARYAAVGGRQFAASSGSSNTFINGLAGLGLGNTIRDALSACSCEE